MKIFFDENFPRHLAEGLAKFQEGRSEEGIEVLYIPTEFGRGALDDEWLPMVGAVKGVVVTQDHNIHRTKQLAALCHQHETGMVFFRPPKKKRYKYWELVNWVMGNWGDVKARAKKTAPPFECQITPKGGLSDL